uniref:Translation initiation factor eIF-2B delta subunit n=1 Tax=Arundo donax TaxID=35708 RepID=A0A0A9FS67_ARUDO
MPKQAKSAKTAQKKDVPQAASTVASEKKVTERLPERERKKDGPHPRMQFDDVHKVEKAKKTCGRQPIRSSKQSRAV